MNTLGRIRYCLKSGRFHGVAAKTRALYWQIIRRYETEVCLHCGRPVRQVWWCHDDSLWERLTGNTGARGRRPGSREPAAGICCIRCFDEAARDDSATGWIEWAPVNLRHLKTIDFEEGDE